MSTDDRGLKACFLAARLEETWIKEFQDSLGGPIFLGLFFFFAFPWFFFKKTAISLCFGRIWRDFPWFSYEKTCFCFSLAFPRENSSFLMFWTDLA